MRHDNFIAQDMEAVMKELKQQNEEQQQEIKDHRKKMKLGKQGVDFG